MTERIDSHIPPLPTEPIFDDWLKEHGYTIDVRDRAAIVARKGFIGIGRFHSFQQACDAVIAYHLGRR